MEMAFLYQLQALQTPAADVFFTGITTLGNKGYVWIGLIAFLLIRPQTRSFALALALTLIVNQILVNLALKPLVARPRPCWLDPDMALLIPLPRDFSFPSGHAASGFCVAAMMVFNRLRGRWIALLLAALIAFSRLYLFVHFPSDVLAGALIGVAVAALGTVCYRRFLCQSAACRAKGHVIIRGRE